jgi:hypothetical protein
MLTIFFYNLYNGILDEMTCHERLMVVYLALEH